MSQILSAMIVLSLTAALSITFAHPSFGQKSPPEAGETHDFEATEYHNTFSFAHKPVLRIKPRDRVATKTIDAAGFDNNNTSVVQGPNPQTGPFYIEGAEPGDVLVVRLEKIEPNRKTAWSGQVLAPYVAFQLKRHIQPFS